MKTRGTGVVTARRSHHPWGWEGRQGTGVIQTNTLRGGALREEGAALPVQGDPSSPETNWSENS